MEAEAVLTLYRLIPDGLGPCPADPSVGGSLPVRAYRYCEPVRTASAHGWYVFPPGKLALKWNGLVDIEWRLNDVYQGTIEQAVQYPGLAARFDGAAPEEIRGYCPPFLSQAAIERGMVQLWTGLLARTAPGWSLLIRPPVNFPARPGWAPYEGVVETDRWFGPVFVNVQLTQTNRWITLPADLPMLQLQPIPRLAYQQRRWTIVESLAMWSPEDWAAYRETVVRPNQDAHRPRGEYATRSRQRRAAE